ncbi:aspartyl protease family protein [Nitrospira lenta]|uniref:DUF4124 domain-containing protein n=1 Tax=Nitrospira lenta TaxID=1436998 RepID=A0A330L974_9BACT|nr:aspartyl protease family protein [Nitrospira lenta]SPP63466.1 exported hypothetical protein [Nitrospira lenta]
MVNAFVKGVVLALVVFPCALFAGDLVQWTDEKGMVHFSDSLDNVPQKFRHHAKQDKFKDKNPQRSSVNSAGGLSSADALILGSMLEAREQPPKLNSFEVPFEAYEGTAQRVIVSVKFNDSVTAPMAIDTGAPGVLISPKLAGQLGIYGSDEGKVLIQAGGIGGSVPALLTFLDKIQVGEARDSFIPATVTRSISGSFEGLLGMHFMSKYSFKIDSVRQVVIFEEIPANSNWPGGRPERWWRDRFKELNSVRAAWKRLVPQEQLWQAQYGPSRFASRQVMEVDKLLEKLDRYASQNSVPQNWR